MGFEGKLGERIANFFTKRTQSVTIIIEKSDEEVITSGIPKGLVLGTLLFLIYIGHIDEEGRGSRIYVDDVKPLHYVNNDLDVIKFKEKVKTSRNGAKTTIVFSTMTNLCSLDMARIQK